MLRFFRGFAKSWFGPLIMGVLVIAFGILGGGVRDVLRGHIANAVVQAGDRSVTSDEFRKMFNRNQEAYLAKTGQPYPLEDAIRQGADQAMVQDLASQTAYAEMLARSGIRPSDDVVATEIRRQAESGNSPELAQVFDAVTGKFKPEQLQRLLADNGITINDFQRELADSTADQDFTSALHEGFQIPRIYAALQGALLLESRDITYFVIPAKSIPVPPKPTDDQLNALIAKLHDQLMLPERRKLTVVRFSAKALAPTMPVDPAAVEQQFEAKKDTYGKPETRSLVEIPLNDPSKAAAVEAALSAGQDPEAVAKSVGVEAVSYTDQPQSAIADSKAATAAFAMSVGQVSGPVQGDFKMVILKVTKITPGQAPDINAAKAQIVADLQASEAADKIYEISQKFEDLRQGGASIVDAAKQVGMTAVSLDPVGADGKDLLTGQVNPILSPKLLTTAFQTAQGADSDVEQDTDKGEYYAVHVDQVIAPAPPGLDEKGVRDFLTKAYFQQTILGALQQKATDAQAALNKGQTMEAVAATYGAQVAHQVGMTRASAQQLAQSIGQPVLAAAFGAKPGVVFTAGSDGLQGIVVGRLDAIHPGDAKQVAQVIEPLRQRGSQSYLAGVQEAVRAASLAMIKPQTDIALARDAMGANAALIARATKPQAGAPTPAKPAS
ncbi:MAG TPA: peptidyl-prolyl cis-trans isomerase [Caulobacteraceae bacterium]|jgi:peptidyl-prolyl cis-trans isomerase D|nr:peptidyl-prolyl cis-trans isomerase [Caulobacteraceae bacterium]